MCNKDVKEKWIQSLAEENEPLHKLSLKVPHGFKGDNLLNNLINKRISFLRATWFLKIIFLNKLNDQKVVYKL